MDTLLLVVLFSLAGSLISLIGGFLILNNKINIKTVIKYVTPFAAGALLAAAFTDTLPEAAHQGSIETALRWTLIGILLFFILERSIKWFHHHHAHKDKKQDSSVPLIIIGDTIHNFLDGIAIAAAFLIDIPTGIIATIAVAAHEIPQEIGDFGLLLDKGVSKSGVIKVNIISGLATVIAAVSFYTIGHAVEIPLDVMLGLVAGFFIYIAVSDIIPSIHKRSGHTVFNTQTIMLLTGVILLSITSTTLHTYIDAENHSDAESTSHSDHIEEEHHHDEEHRH